MYTLTLSRLKKLQTLKKFLSQAPHVVFYTALPPKFRSIGSQWVTAWLVKKIFGALAAIILTAHTLAPQSFCHVCTQNLQPRHPLCARGMAAACCKPPCPCDAMLIPPRPKQPEVRPKNGWNPFLCPFKDLHSGGQNKFCRGHFTYPDYIGHDFATLTRAGNLRHNLASAYSLIIHCNNLFFNSTPLVET